MVGIGMLLGYLLRNLFTFYYLQNINLRRLATLATLCSLLINYIFAVRGEGSIQRDINLVQSNKELGNDGRTPRLEFR